MKKRCAACNKKIDAGESAYIEKDGEVFRVCLDCQQKYERKNLDKRKNRLSAKTAG